MKFEQKIAYAIEVVNRYLLDHDLTDEQIWKSVDGVLKNLR